MRVLLAWKRGSMGVFLKTAILAVATALAALAAALPAEATIISVANFSFETLPAGGLPNGCGTNCFYSVDAIPGWTNAGDSGQFQPGPPATVTYFDTLSDGPTNAYSNGGDITQIVTTVQVGAIYSLLVDIGNRFEQSEAGSANLLVNGNLYAGFFLNPPPEGGWGTEEVLYTGLAADAGQPLTILLRSSGAQGNFDNIRLTSAIPEPSTLALFAAGLVSLLAMRRRRMSAA
jgi:hypothetical protein